ncbi:hypothetical protein [Streptomyces sp. NPDC058773]|uniref:hypothetical protein n=1 Tax=Streptomyces sp. NPDC058773 TaxID=3346632 RepID=UPI003693D2B0
MADGLRVTETRQPEAMATDCRACFAGPEAGRDGGLPHVVEEAQPVRFGQFDRGVRGKDVYLLTEQGGASVELDLPMVDLAVDDENSADSAGRCPKE